MKKIIFFISYFFTKDKIIKKFILHNKKIFKKNFYRNENLILVEFNGWSLQHIIISYISNVLAKKYSCTIHAYPGYVLNKYSLDWKSKLKFLLANLIPIKQFLIYSSFGTKKFFYPILKRDDTEIAKKIYKKELVKVKNLNNIVNIKINKVFVGDLIYDSYLKFYKCPTINFKDNKFKNFLFESIKSFIFWERYLKENKVKGIVFTHAVYSGAMLTRIAAYKYPGIELISGNSNSVYNFNKKNFNPWLDFKKLKKDFLKLTTFEKKKGLEFSKKLIEQRIKGINNSDINSAKKSPYNLGFKKRVIKDNSKIKVLIATHCFLDSPHIFGKFFFPDFLQWLNFLSEISKKTNYDWYIKSHPNFNPITYKLLKDFVKINKNFKLLPLNYGHKQILKEKIDFVLTVYGTIGWEYGFLGIPVINASKNNPHYNYKFNINPKSFKNYKKILLNLKNIKLKINKNEIYEFYLIAYVYHVVDWIFRDQKQLKKALKNFNKSFEKETYIKWINSFNIDKHKQIIQSLSNFLESKNFKIQQKHCGYNFLLDIINKDKFIPKT